MTNDILSSGYTLRPASWDDIAAIAELTHIVSVADNDPIVAVSVETLNSYWNEPGCNIETDAWIVIAPDGELVGYEEAVQYGEHTSLFADGFVHPEHKNKGLGTAMLHAMEAWADRQVELAAPGMRVQIRIGTGEYDHHTHKFLENEGYQRVRYFWRMQIEMDAPPPNPIWPEGIELRPFDPEAHMQLVYEADHDSFRDHWGFVPIAFEQWKHRRTVENPFDPELWYVAWDEDQVAGICLCRYRAELENMAWVSILGVRPKWRKLGLGTALLQHAFCEFHQRRDRQVGLGVDASNPSGATRLYERAGMHVAQSYITFEKELRPGKEISVQSLES